MKPFALRIALTFATMCLASCVPRSGNDLLAEVKESTRRLEASPDNHAAMHRQRHALEQLVEWYDGLPLEQRAAWSSSAGLNVEVEATGEQGLNRFTPVNQIRVHGLDHDYRREGAGVPVLAWRPNDGYGKFDDLRPPEGIYTARTAVFVSASGQRRDTLQFLSPENHDSVSIGNRTWPLAADSSAPVATLVGHAEALRKTGFTSMLRPLSSPRHEKLYLIDPYDPNRIPLLMVHGLQSTPVQFGNLVNDLHADPQLRSRYQIWHYYYPTGLPVMQNAAVLRKVLRQTLQKLDPDGNDFATNHIVVMGHSMGGILSHTLVCDSGYKLWDSVIHVRPEKLRAPRADIEATKELFVFQRDPRVRRVIFIAVPHRGSSFADNWIGRLGLNLFQGDDRFVSTLHPILEHHRADLDPFIVKMIEDGKFSSIRTLSPRSPALRALAEIPPQVPFHSIIGQRFGGPFWKGTDGFVSYESSHLEGAESELIIRSGHLAFRKEAAVREIKRILLLPLAEASPQP
ncbi:MAG: hypothetical protein QM755_06535 [Luteolibacter sp.]